MKPSRETLVNVLKYFDVHWRQVTRNALNVACPFCDDTGEHCGVFYDKDEFMYSCWKCKAGGNLFDLLHEAANCTFQDYQSILNSQYSEVYVASVSDEIAKIVGVQKETQAQVKAVTWPPLGSMPIEKLKNDPVLTGFLAKRKLSYEFCLSKRCYVGLAERYAYRFLIPVYQNNRVVAFQGRDMTGRSPNKYLTEGDVSNYLYGFDDVDDTKPVGITEGVISSWSVDNAVCSFSASLGDKQLAMMTLINPPYWVLCWDMGSDGSDKYWEGTRVAKKLAEFFGRDKVKYVTMPKGEDPDSLGIVRMRELLRSPQNIWTTLNQ